MAEVDLPRWLVHDRWRLCPAASPLDSARPTPRWLVWIAVAGLLVAGIAFRLSLVAGYRVPAVDGRQYYALSQQLVKDGRFAYSPPPAPLAWSRMPGYALFLAHVVVREAPVDLATHLLRATRANALLDVATALLVFLLLRERRSGLGASLCGLVLVLVCPILFVLASHALTESLSTFLATLELYLAVRAMRDRLLLFAVLCGVVAGFTQLVRADSVTLIPAVLLALGSAAAPRRQRCIAIAACGIAAAVVFAPWPARNLARFGQPYFASAYWRTAWGGRPLPTGAIAWARTWTTGARNEFFLDPIFAFEQPFSPASVLPAMFDDPAERARLVALIDRYNRERLSPAVDAGFRELAEERTRRAPFRTFVTLPLRRMGTMFDPVPNSELSMTSTWLKLPARRAWVRFFDYATYALALLGALGLWWRERARDKKGYPAGSMAGSTATLLGLAVAGRCALMSQTIPMGLSQRHLVEVYPVLLALAACGLALPAWLLRRRR
ncbi:MAG: hypothetical protein EXR72_09925 [Myxococcales bacterium]|nr:hypothetical protein [Myxococcales bacterium]